MNNFIYSRDRAFTVSLLSHPPLPVFPHLLHSPSLISLSLFFFGAIGAPLRNSPPCWKAPSVLLLSGGTRHEGADWSLEIGIKRTLNGDLFFIFFPSGRKSDNCCLGSTQLLLRRHISRWGFRWIHKISTWHNVKNLSSCMSRNMSSLLMEDPGTGTLKYTVWH